MDDKVESIELVPNPYGYNKQCISLMHVDDYSFLYFTGFRVYPKNDRNDPDLTYTNFETNIFNKKNSDSNKADAIKLYDFMIAIIADLLENYTINATGLTAINFINPVSAFISIAGQNDDNLFSSLTGTSSPSYLYNYSYSKFSLGGKVETTTDSYYYDSLVWPSSVAIGEIDQIDKPSTVGLTWAAISVLAIGLSALIYYRKDFK